MEARAHADTAGTANQNAAPAMNEPQVRFQKSTDMFMWLTVLEKAIVAAGANATKAAQIAKSPRNTRPDDQAKTFALSFIVNPCVNVNFY
jgi:hypothetical protein